ncbi:MAG: riboflavin synthase [Desulfatiglandaceae bacterium]
MFTGLIEGIGTVRGIRRSGGDASITIVPPSYMVDFKVGESIAVNGVCLTVTGTGVAIFTADVSMETLARTTLGELEPSQRVNLERALRLTDRLGGHLVSGHVDGIGRISSKKQRAASWWFRIHVDESISRYMIEKGSIAVDGISLTINTCAKDFFEVNIIPQTQMETTLLKRSVGDGVNIETDLIGKYIERLLSRKGETRESTPASRIDLDMLMKYGFDK